MRKILSIDEIKHLAAQKVSEIEMESDKVVYEYLKLKDQFNIQRKFILLNEYLDFNCPFVMPHLIPLFVSIDAVNFIIDHNTEIKRKLTIGELMQFSDNLKLLKLLKCNPANFAEFKINVLKIKTVKKIS